MNDAGYPKEKAFIPPAFSLRKPATLARIFHGNAPACRDSGAGMDGRRRQERGCEMQGVTMQKHIGFDATPSCFSIVQIPARDHHERSGLVMKGMVKSS